mmetsp:Transcript_13123/g.29866  ORF Transcript_13123/g.29866 Transcript_13123/m.29866 type:complete len:261 (+) Transcript_13123:104-886(+)
MPLEVRLNIYDLMEQTAICCGFFHTGVEIFGVEYSFAQGAGIYEGRPRQAPDGRFRESIELGTIERTDDARAALDRLRPDFPGDAYSLIFKNCNDFSSAFSRALLGRDIPGYVNRLARLGRAWPIRCFLPPHLKAGSATADRAPLLSTSPTGSQAQLFTGSGHSLTGQAAASSAGASSSSGGFFKGVFGRGSATTAVTATAVTADTRQARELRASAAARRLAPQDLENGGGKSQAPVAAPAPAPSPSSGGEQNGATDDAE